MPRKRKFVKEIIDNLQQTKDFFGMSQVRNRHYFIFFAIFFVVCSPFLVFLSFGYDVNLRDQNISNTTTVKVDTFPKNALIKVRNETKGTSPTELYSQDSSPFNLVISSPNYKSESFLIAPNQGYNSSVDLKNLVLLPTNAELTPSSNIAAKDYESIAFLSKDQDITRTIDGFQIRDFGVGGFVNNPLFISEREFIGGKSQESFLLQKPVEESLFSNQKEWLKFGEGTFYKDNYLLQKKTNYWLIKDISINFPNGIRHIIKLDQSNYLVLDNASNLWNWNGLTTRFIDTGFDSIFGTSSPEYIWLLKNNSIFRLPYSDFASPNVDWKANMFLTSDSIKLDKGKFKVASVFQGVGIQVNQHIFYVPDFATGSFSLITNNATSFFADSNSMFWLDSYNYPNFYNFFTQQKHIFPQISKEYTELTYVPEWNRIMLYAPDRVGSIWFNKEINQPNILSYSTQEWIAGSSCLPKIMDKVQYCIRNKELVLYKNNLIF